jgi:hypothetical protein
VTSFSDEVDRIDKVALMLCSQLTLMTCGGERRDENYATAIVKLAVSVLEATKIFKTIRLSKS